MNELGEFFITFRTTGINELLDQMKDLNTKLDSLNTSFDKSATKGDSFFDKLSNWGLKVATLVAGIAGIGTAIRDAFNLSDSIIKLNVSADVAGVKAEDVESLGIAIAPLLGGNKAAGISEAAEFYRNMTETQTQWWRGQYSKQVIEEMSRAHVTGLKADSTTEEWIAGLVDALSYYQGQNTKEAVGARNLFAKAFGIKDATMLLFGEGRQYVADQLKYGREHMTMSGTNLLRDAYEQTRAKMELREQWENLIKNLIPGITAVEDAITDVLESVNAFFNDEMWTTIKGVFSWINTTFKGGWELVKSWLDENFGTKEGEEPFEEQARIALGKTFDSAWPTLNKVLNGTATISDLNTLERRLSESGTLTPELRNAFLNERNKILGGGWALVNDPAMRELYKNLKYDPNLNLIDVIKSTSNSLNTRAAGGSNSETTNNTANFGNIYITGTENVGREVRGQLQTAVNSMGSK